MKRRLFERCSTFNFSNLSNIDCDLCDFKAKESSEFIKHVNTHQYNTQSSHKCDLCGYISRSTEVRIYEGEESPIVMRREYLITFNCDFDLRMYPFDTQVCVMEFQINGIPKRYVTMAIEAPEGCPECDGGEYLGNRNLVEYLVGSTVMEDLYNFSSVFSRSRVKVEQTFAMTKGWFLVGL